MRRVLVSYATWEGVMRSVELEALFDAARNGTKLLGQWPYFIEKFRKEAC
jgi:hypothetical protein